MGKRKKPAEIQRLLAEADRDLAKGLAVTDVCRKLGVSEATYHRWRQRLCVAQTDATRRLRQLESEVARLKELVAELLLDNRMLRDVAKKKWCPLVSGGPVPATSWRLIRSQKGEPAGSSGVRARPSATGRPTAPRTCPWSRPSSGWPGSTSAGATGSSTPCSSARGGR
jgi:transposase-like protein